MTWLFRDQARPFLVSMLLAVIFDMTAVVASPKSTCIAAAREVAHGIDVPSNVLEGVLLAAGPHIEPWTVLVDGENSNFSTLQAAKAWVFARYMRGERDFSVGCFGLSFRLFHRSFQSIDQMFDARRNATVFAAELQRFHARYGSWSMALSMFHAQHVSVADVQPDKLPLHAPVLLSKRGNAGLLPVYGTP